MDEGILSLKWNNHTTSFLHKLSSLHKIELYSDVTLACDGKYFPVHKFVLSVCSEYFEEILSKTKCQHPVIVLKDIRHRDLESLLNYMYSGEANVSQSELSHLIKAAECLKIKGLAVPDEPPEKEKKRHSDSHKESPSKRRRKVESPPQTPNDAPPPTYSSDRLSDREDRLSNSSQNYCKNDEGLNEFVEVKQEPKVESPEPEEIDLEGYSLTEETLNGDQIVGSQHQQMLNDPIGGQIPGPSGIQEDSLTWNPNYSEDDFSTDGDTQPMERCLFLNQFGASTSIPQRSDIHSGLMPLHLCPACPKSFVKKSDFIRHQRTHTGEKPYSCGICGFKSALKGNLKRHIFMVHKTISKD